MELDDFPLLNRGGDRFRSPEDLRWCEPGPVIGAASGAGMERGDLLGAPRGSHRSGASTLSPRMPRRGDRQPATNAPAMTNAIRHSLRAALALTRLPPGDSQLAAKTGAAVTDIKKTTIAPLGHPAPRPVPRGGRRKNAAEVVNDLRLIEDEFIPTVAKRGAADHRCARSSAASAASANHRRCPGLVAGDVPADDWVSWLSFRRPWVPVA